MTIDFRALERASYGPSAEAIELTPELLGQVIACALQVYGEETDAASRLIFEKLFLTERPVPPTIAKILHVEHAVGGPRIEEATRMTVAPQASGIAGRLNPDNVSWIAKTDQLQAYTLLSYYASLFPDEVDWIKRGILSEAT
jgi:hypothetical protein